MKILITTDLYKPSINGVVTSINNLVEELEKNGHDVRILSLSGKKSSYYEDGIYYLKSVPLKFYPTTRLPITFGRKYMRELVDWQPHIVHSQCEFFSFEFAEFIARSTGAQTIHTYHTLYEQYTKYIFNGKVVKPELIAGFMKERLRKIKVIIAPTEKVKIQLRNYGCNNNIEVVPTGINLDRFLIRIDDERKASLKNKLGIPLDSPIIVSIGRLGFEKNIKELISGHALILKKVPSAYFLIVGDGPAKQSLMEQAEDLGISKNVIFSGMIDYNEVPDYYQLGDVFACASTSEAQGLTYVEAAASGVPLVCREDPSLVNVLNDGNNGYVFTSVDEMAEKTMSILIDSEFKSKADIENQKVIKRFSKAEFGKSICAIYKQLWNDSQIDDNDKKGIMEFLEYFKLSKS